MDQKKILRGGGGGGANSLSKKCVHRAWLTNEMFQLKSSKMAKNS